MCIWYGQESRHALSSCRQASRWGQKEYAKDRQEVLQQLGIVVGEREPVGSKRTDSRTGRRTSRQAGM